MQPEPAIRMPTRINLPRQRKQISVTEQYTPSAFRTHSQQPLLHIAEAVVVRSGTPILSIDSLELAENEHLAVLGPNGSGKSTFIKLITREVFPLHNDEPPVRFRGSERVMLTEIKKTIGTVSSTMQDQITVHLPAFDIVCGGLFGTLGIPAQCTVTEESRTRALHAMERLGVADLAGRDIKTLSTGQARRVLFARALVHEPDVFVLDEPCSGLDPEGMYHIRQAMRTLAQSGTSIVLVTHFPEDIIPEIERLVLLKNGRIFADGAKEELLTDAMMGELFEVPVQIQRNREYYSLVSAY